MPNNKKNQRNEELRFLYENEERKKVKPKKRADKKKSAQKVNNNRFDFDNEIVIGVTRVNDSNKKKTSPKKIKNNTKVNTKNQQNKKTISTKKKEISRDLQESYDKEKREKRKDKAKKIIIYILLMSVFCTAMILFLLSPVFNIVQIEVLDNSSIPAETYISLSKIQMGENIFKMIKHKVVQNIKEEAYVEDVQVVRQLPDRVQLIIKERVPTFMIEYANSYVYLNNQGYILEISEEKLNVPIIKSISTKEEDIKTGNRINNEDLEKLNSVLKIMETANGMAIGNFITYIDISNKQNYLVRMEEKKKTIYLGDDSNLSNKFLYAKAIIEKEDGIEGDILANGATKGSVVFQYKE